MTNYLVLTPPGLNPDQLHEKEPIPETLSTISLQRRDPTLNGGGSGEERGDKRDVRQSLTECWSQVRDKVEFAENCE